jgi:epoxyqueuosine reductase
MEGRSRAEQPEQRILDEAHRLGFDLAGIVAARPGGHLEAYRSWLASGYHGEMDYLSRADRVARRQELGLILPGVRSIVTVGLNYYPGDTPSVADGATGPGLIARYAWGSDYHQLMLSRLEELAAFVSAEAGRAVSRRAYVDTGPLLERDHAAEAGLGFIGKNTCLINPRLGPWIFLGELLLGTDLAPSEKPVLPSCGTCRRCLDACPTHALVRPYVLDARRCISYLTIELKGAIPRELRPLIGNRIYGCDECQEVCPWHRFARVTSEGSFVPSGADRCTPLLAPLLELDEEAFHRRFDGTVVARIGRGRLLRNVAVALGNSEDRHATRALITALGDAEPLVRSHAAWALGRLGGEGAVSALACALAAESVEDTREEIDNALQQSVR